MRALWIATALLAVDGRGARASGDAARGEKLFRRVRGLPLARAAAVESVGPSLYGVFGRRAGEGGDFRYSPALRRSGIVWDQHTIETFITDPQATVPGNRMPFAGIPDAGARADLIAYLVKTFK